MRILALLALAILSLLSSCINNKEDKVVLPTPIATVYADVPYGTDTLQKMDVYLPAGRSMAHTPILLMIHGGGWYRGDKKDYESLGMDSFFNRKGYAVIYLNYRLAVNNATRYPVQLDDIDGALSLISRMGEAWQVNSTEIGTYGSSAGAHLSMLDAYSRNKGRNIKAIICLSSFTDLADTSVSTNQNIVGRVEDFLGAHFPGHNELWASASPINYLNNAVPTMLLEGDADEIAYPVQSGKMKDSLDKRHVPCSYTLWHGYGHSMVPDINELRVEMLGWMELYVRK